MSHYSNLVIVENTESVTSPNGLEEAVKKAMGPPEVWWDWYQIGGRWTGTFDSYNPENDPANIEECFLCKGTGKRMDPLGVQERAKNPSYTCNGCDGKGRHSKWPTQWAKHPGDIMPIEKLTAEQYEHFFRVVTDYGTTFGGEDYLPWKPIGEMFPRKEKPPIEWLKKEFAGYLVVIVDSHN